MLIAEEVRKTHRTKESKDEIERSNKVLENKKYENKVEQGKISRNFIIKSFNVFFSL